MWTVNSPAEQLLCLMKHVLPHQLADSLISWAFDHLFLDPVILQTPLTYPCTKPNTIIFIQAISLLVAVISLIPLTSPCRKPDTIIFIHAFSLLVKVFSLIPLTKPNTIIVIYAFSLLVTVISQITLTYSRTKPNPIIFIHAFSLLVTVFSQITLTYPRTKPNTIIFIHAFSLLVTQAGTTDTEIQVPATTAARNCSFLVPDLPVHLTPLFHILFKHKAMCAMKSESDWWHSVVTLWLMRRPSRSSSPALNIAEAADLSASLHRKLFVGW